MARKRKEKEARRKKDEKLRKNFLEEVKASSEGKDLHEFRKQKEEKQRSKMEKGLLKKRPAAKIE